MNSSYRFTLPCLLSALVLLPAHADSHAHEAVPTHADHAQTCGHQHQATAAENAEAPDHSHAPFEHLCAHSWDFELGGYADNPAMQQWVKDGLRHVHFDHKPTPKTVSRLCWVEGARTLAMGQREEARTWLKMSQEDEALINLACLEYENGDVAEALRLMEVMIRMNDEQGVEPPVAAVFSLPLLRYASGLISHEELEKFAAELAAGPGAWVHEHVDISWILENVVRTPEDAKHLRARLGEAADAGHPEAEVALIALAEMRIMLVGQCPGWQQRLRSLAPKYARAAKMQQRVEMLQWVLTECLPTLMPKPSR